MRKVVLDTSAYSHLIKGDRKIASVLSLADRIFLPLFVIAELVYGFKLGKRESANRNYLAKFESKRTVSRFLPGSETIELYSEVKKDLKLKGKPIPEHDMWIAAITIETGSTLLTYDKHFSYISKVRIWDHE